METSPCGVLVWWGAQPLYSPAALLIPVLPCPAGASPMAAIIRLCRKKGKEKAWRQVKAYPQPSVFWLLGILKMRRAVVWEHSPLFIPSRNDNSDSRFSASLWLISFYPILRTPLPSPPGIAA